MDDLASVDWSRAQFALTAIYHWLFVPLTLGLSFILAIMETIYVKTGNEQWKKITQFWMKLFAINFAIGVATGIIMEFEFGTNWANYSWFVGDIFGAPLAVEGIFAFFLEATFFAVMFFGWEKVSKKFHLLSTWLVAIGSNLSAFWILVANGWMQYPIGMQFNPDTARNEMVNFFDIIFSPIAVAKFTHTISSGFIVSAMFVIGISAWFILKNRHVEMAKKSIVVAASFGFIMSLFLFFNGDESAYQVAQKQPMKLAAMEGLYDGERRAGIVAFGILNPKKEAGNDEKEFLFDFAVPYTLSLLGHRNMNAFVPGINDIVFGNLEYNLEPIQDKITKGKIAVEALKNYKLAKKEKNEELANLNKSLLDENIKNLGYGYLNEPKDAVPPVALSFYSFHIMVMLGTFLFGLFTVILYLSMANDITKFRKVLWISVFSIPLGYIAAEAGWIVAEVGRQPWAIQDLMPVGIAATNLASINVKLSFAFFAILFTVLLIAEIKIMLKQIQIGFEEEESHV